MDRELPTPWRRRRLARRAAAVAATLAVGWGALAWLPTQLGPSVERSRVRTGHVDHGPLEVVVNASGRVTPASQQVVSSPFEARVVEILKETGEPVRRGEAILVLDASATRLELERLGDRIARKVNERRQLEVELERELVELAGLREVQALEVEILEHRLEQRRTLHREGLISRSALAESRVELDKARIEARRLERSRQVARESTSNRLEGLALELATLRRDRDDARRRLETATARAGRSGVLTWVLPEEGATVERGAVIARVADLETFSVEATVTDVHAGRLAVGQPVRVLVDGEPLGGRLERIHPTIEAGTVHFTVGLDTPDHKALHDSLRVDVLVIAERQPDALRVPRGPFLRGGKREPVFVVDGDVAVRRMVTFGLVGYEHVAIEEGLAAGEEVILSDMEDYLHAERLALEGPPSPTLDNALERNAP